MAIDKMRTELCALTNASMEELKKLSRWRISELLEEAQEKAEAARREEVLERQRAEEEAVLIDPAELLKSVSALEVPAEDLPWDHLPPERKIGALNRVSNNAIDTLKSHLEEKAASAEKFKSLSEQAALARPSWVLVRVLVSKMLREDKEDPDSDAASLQRVASRLSAALGLQGAMLFSEPWEKLDETDLVERATEVEEHLAGRDFCDGDFPTNGAAFLALLIRTVLFKSFGLPLFE